MAMTPRGETARILHEHNVEISAREIFISPEESEGGVDCVMACQVLKNIRLLSSINTDPILIHIGTLGGEWYYGMMIYDAIAACPCYVTTLSYAVAGSMSSIIPQAADKRVLTQNCDFMIHEGTNEYAGTCRGAVADMEQLKRLSRVMVDIYVAKCVEGPHFKGWSDRRVRNYLEKQMQEREDWYMTAHEAVEYGFMDGVLGEEGFETIAAILAPAAE